MSHVLKSSPLSLIFSTRVYLLITFQTRPLMSHLPQGDIILESEFSIYSILILYITNAIYKFPLLQIHI